MHTEALTEKGQHLLPTLLTFTGFYLAGGTALALQIGHRVSVDFDFFSPERSDTSQEDIMLTKWSRSAGTLVIPVPVPTLIRPSPDRYSASVSGRDPLVGSSLNVSRHKL